MKTTHSIHPSFYFFLPPDFALLFGAVEDAVETTLVAREVAFELFTFVAAAEDFAFSTCLF